MRRFQGSGCVQPAGHFGVVAGGEDVDDLVVLHVGHRGGVVGVARVVRLDEGGLVEPDGGGAVPVLAIGLEQGLAIGRDCIVDGVPVTGQFVGHFFDGPSPADLAGRPFGRPGGQQALLGRDAMVAEHPGPLRAVLVHAAHPSFFQASDMGVP
jgi:hypothetical protein